ncbi:MAG: acyl-CoA dehydrogenase family protein [Gammaproteobacteria bacterium]|nr:acyl-CoA dehydrogenase family protein [Gammaproteobacteria bacterium]
MAETALAGDGARASDAPPPGSPRSWPAVPRRALTLSGAEARLPDTIAEFQQTLRRFALEVLRPTGIRLDRMTPEQVIAADSPYWDVRRQYLDLGINLETLAGMEPAERALMFSIVFEELGYGDAGLAISMGAALLPQYISAKFGNQALLQRFPDTLIGCWGITEPDHGSDTLDPSASAARPGGQYGRPNCVATFGADKIVLNGQKSAWVSNGTIAKVCILYCAADTGAGPDPHRGCVLVLPLDLDGISRGKPLDKLGQRALNQGEIYFDNVEVPLQYVLAGPEDYARAVYCIHSEANSLMGSVFTGLAHAAYDLALDYAHERRQGGAPIIRHQSVQTRLFHMYRKVEMARALTRRVLAFNGTEPMPALQAGMAAKISCTQIAFEVTSDALQIFGGNGLTREYPLEKMLRDARASMIEDGCNEILAIKGGTYLMDHERLHTDGD